MQHHCLVESGIGNSCCNKKHHRRCLLVESPRTDGISNELTQVKTLIGQHC